MKSLINKGRGIGLFQEYYKVFQCRWAQKMNNLTKDLSKKQQIFILSGFIVFSGSMIILIICKGVSLIGSDTINIVPISKSIHVNEKFRSNPGLFPISQKEYEKVISFRLYIDSLETSLSGKRAADSIKLLRPGLLDSVVFIENYYKSNIKN